MAKRATDVDDYVGKRVRQRRLELGLSQGDLAAALDITFQQVQKYELGINRVAAGRLWDIAGCLDIDVGYFFEGISASRARKPSKAKSAASPA